MKYKLRPSSSGRFLKCTASVQFAEKPFEENVNNLKGNLQHEVASLRLEQIYKNKENAEEIQKLMDYDNIYYGKNPKIKVKWDSGCDFSVDSYISLVKKIYSQYNAKEIYIEESIDLNFYGNQIKGKIDCAILTDEYLFVIDLKTGRMKVEVNDDPQILMYALGLLQKLNKENNLPQKIVIGISQAVINNTELIEYSLKDIRDWYAKQSQAMWEINNNELKYRPDSKICKYCVNNSKCNERIRQGITIKY